MDISTDKSLNGSNTSHEDANMKTITQNGRSLTATPTLNPFLTNVQCNGNGNGNGNDYNSTKSNSTVQSPILPPVPPRQRAISVDIPKIHIPLNVLRRPKLSESDNNDPNTVIMNGNSSNIEQSESIPLSNGTSKQNGNCYQSETDTNIHDSTCPCQSGAHPKQKSPKTSQQNGIIKADGLAIGKYWGNNIN